MPTGIRTVQETWDDERYERDEAVSNMIEEFGDADNHEAEQVVAGITQYVMRCWQAAKQAKHPIEQVMLQSLRQRSGVYSADETAAIEETGGSNIYMMLTDEKCNAAESWLEEILFPPDSEPWDVQPTSVPSMPDMPDRTEMYDLTAQKLNQEISQELAMQGIEPTQEAFNQLVHGDPLKFAKRFNDTFANMQAELQRVSKERARVVLTEAIKDKMQQGGWREEFRATIEDIITFPAGILKGIVVRKVDKLRWANDGLPEVERADRWEWESVSPFDIYPSPTSRGINDGYLLEVHRLSPDDLYQMTEIEDSGYDNEAIREVLQQHRSGGISNWLGTQSDSERAMLERRETQVDDPEGKIEALQFWGDVRGQDLLDWGLGQTLDQYQEVTERMSDDEGEDEEDYTSELDRPVIDPERMYSAEVWVIGSHTIKATLNPDPLGHKPYYKASFRERKGQFWGMGLPELIVDIQRMCNATARALSNNMAIASGPQFGVDFASLDRSDDATDMRPFKVWKFDLRNQMNTSSQPPLWSIQPPMNAPELLRIYEFFSNEADNKTGLPKYSYGSGQGGGGALSTASGFSMMMSNTSRSIRRVVSTIDSQMIAPSVRKLFEWLMLFDDEFEYSGDSFVTARGSAALQAKERTQQRRNELLGLVLQSPQAMAIIQEPGVAELLRDLFKEVGLAVEDIVPTKEQIEARQQAQIAQMQQQQMEQQMQGAAGRQLDRGASMGQVPGAGQALDPAGNPAGGGDFQQPMRRF